MFGDFEWIGKQQLQVSGTAVGFDVLLWNSGRCTHHMMLSTVHVTIPPTTAFRNPCTCRKVLNVLSVLPLGSRSLVEERICLERKTPQLEKDLPKDPVCTATVCHLPPQPLPMFPSYVSQPSLRLQAPPPQQILNRNERANVISASVQCQIVSPSVFIYPHMCGRVVSRI